MAYTYKSVISELKKGNYLSCYWLCGDEPFYIDRIVAYIEKYALSKAEKSFNLHICYGKEVSVRQVIELARRFPMMAQRQVVIIKEAQEIQDINKKEAQNLLLTYCRKPLPSTVLVFAYKYKKLPAHTELQKQIKTNTVLLQSQKVYDNRLPDWIMKYCKEEGIKITEGAAMMLTEYVGNDLSRIANELNKALMGKELTQLTISENFVLTHIGISKEYNIFELQSALAYKDIFKANRIINYFEKNTKEHPVIPIIAVLFNYFIKLLILQENSGRPKDELKAISGVNVHNHYIMKEYTIAQKNYTIHKILSIMHYLHQADLQVKGVDSVASPHQVLKELVFKILHI